MELYGNGIGYNDAEFILDQDINKYINIAKSFPYFDKLSPTRKAALIDIAYTHGQTGYSKYKNLFGLLEKENWKEAGDSLLNTKWYQYGSEGIKERVNKVRTMLQDDKMVYHSGGSVKDNVIDPGYVSGRGNVSAILEGGEIVIPKDVIAGNQSLYDTLASSLLSGDLKRNNESLTESINSAMEKTSNTLSSTMASILSSTTNTIVQTFNTSNSMSSGGRNISDGNLLNNMDLLSIMQGMI
jgi:hypothetical protein